MDIGKAQNIRATITWIGVFMYEDCDIKLCIMCMNNPADEGEVCKECGEYYTKLSERLKNEEKQIQSKPL